MSSTAFNDELNWSRFEAHRGYSKAFLDAVRRKRRQQARAEREKRFAKKVVPVAPEPKPEPVAAPEPEKAPEPESTVVPFATPMRALILSIAREHGLTYADMIGKSRRKHIVQARHEAIWAVRDARPDMSLPQIGRLFHKDHTSILHALRKRGQL